MLLKQGAKTFALSPAIFLLLSFSRFSQPIPAEKKQGYKQHFML